MLIDLNSLLERSAGSEEFGDELPEEGGYGQSCDEGDYPILVGQVLLVRAHIPKECVGDAALPAFLLVDVDREGSETARELIVPESTSFLVEGLWEGKFSRVDCAMAH